VSGAARARKSLSAAAGIFTGPAAWIVNTELGYVLAAGACGRGFPAVPVLSAVMLAFALAGGCLSWRAWRRITKDSEANGGAPDHLLAATGVLTSLLFACVILMHVAAGLVFDGCER
jgi:threonine/homoserine/homoserine lactone efflux protein